MVCKEEERQTTGYGFSTFLLRDAEGAGRQNACSRGVRAGRRVVLESPPTSATCSHKSSNVSSFSFAFLRRNAAISPTAVSNCHRPRKGSVGGGAVGVPATSRSDSQPIALGAQNLTHTSVTELWRAEQWHRLRQLGTLRG